MTTINTRQLLITCAFTMLLCAVGSHQAGANTSGTLLREIPHPDPQAGDMYGRNLAVTSQGNILVGGQLRSNAFTEQGIAYVMNGVSGERVLTLQNPEPAENDRFGAFVAATQNHLIVAAFNKNDGAVQNSGRVYVFDTYTGQLVHTLYNPTPGLDENFGYGLGTLGSHILVGSRGDDTAGTDTGTVYMFHGETGALLQTIVNPAPTTEDFFGFSVCGVGSSKILVGALTADYGATDTGAAFLFDAWSGQLLHMFTNPDPVPYAYMGYILASRGESDILISALGGNLATYHFDVASGQLKHRIPNPEPQPLGMFGTACFVGSDILIGDPMYDNGISERAGRAYLYDGKTGDLLHTFETPQPNVDGRFGISFGSLNGDWVIGSADATVNGLPGAGSLYVYKGRFGFASAQNWNLFE